MEHLFRFIDPTSLNKQGHDEGTQYRVGIYYLDETDKPVIDSFIESQRKQYPKELVIEIETCHHYYPAETYHQHYLDKNPQGYCHVNLNLIRENERS